MQKIYNNIFFFFLFFSSIIISASAQYGEPLKLTPHLSANFGELRNNHFHSGIDFKTQQVINKPIYAIGDGYISRISVSPGGYGLALYINHPETNHTSVYGHLNNFAPAITEYVIQKQYELERFRVDLYLDPNEIPVRKGEQIALSGNTGSSGGPHLHFEIRDIDTQNPLDPLLFVAKEVVDTQSPDIRGIAIYPIDNEGLINGTTTPLRLPISKDKAGNLMPIHSNIIAWGKVGFGVSAYDKMNGQANIYGVKHVRLFVDDKLIFSSSINEYAFSDTRMLNSFIDFEYWRSNRSMFMKSFVEPGNTLPFYNMTLNKGYIYIAEERDYKIKYELEDNYSNVTVYNFIVKGKKQPVPNLPACKSYFPWKFDNRYAQYDFTINILSGNLYKDFCYTHQSIPAETNSEYYSNIHQVNHTPVPLHKYGKIWIKLLNDTLQQKDKLGIVKIDKSNKQHFWIGGNYKHGGIEVSITELGDKYAIAIDSVAPVIAPINPHMWKQNGQIRVRLTDDLSGVNYFRGTIDGEFILFKHDSKSSIYTYVFDQQRLKGLSVSTFHMVARDGAGNEKQYRYDF